MNNVGKTFAFPSVQSIHSYCQYLDYLYKSRPAPDAIEVFSSGYHDYLQNPLQVGWWIEHLDGPQRITKQWYNCLAKTMDMFTCWYIHLPFHVLSSVYIA